MSLCVRSFVCIALACVYVCVCFVQLHDDVALEKCGDSIKETSEEERGEERKGIEGKRKERQEGEMRGWTGEERWRKRRQVGKIRRKERRTGKKDKREENEGKEEVRERHWVFINQSVCPLQINTQPHGALMAHFLFFDQ